MIYIVAFTKFDDFMEIMEYDDEYRIESLKELVETIDPASLALLEFICRFLQYDRILVPTKLG